MRLGKILAITPLEFQGESSTVSLVTTERLRCLRKQSTSPTARREAEIVAHLTDFQPFVPASLGEDENGFYYSVLDGLNLAWRMEQARAVPECRQELAEQLGVALRTIHTWEPPLPRPDPTCTWLETALSQLAAPSQDPITDPFSPFRGTTYAALHSWVLAKTPMVAPRLAFCHGDACLPNFLSDGETITGAVDWGDGGWADPRFDLATALWSLRRNTPNDPHTPRYLEAFLKSYGGNETLESLSLFEALYTLPQINTISINLK